MKGILEGDGYKDGGYSLYKREKQKQTAKKEKTLSPLEDSLIKMYPADMQDLF